MRRQRKQRRTGCGIAKFSETVRGGLRDISLGVGEDADQRRGHIDAVEFAQRPRRLQPYLGSRIAHRPHQQRNGLTARRLHEIDDR